MNNGQERQLNQAAYRRLRDSINQTYPSGQFLAISGDQIVAAAGRFDELQAALDSLGQDPAQVLIVEAGVEYPETAIIFG
jgi:hypothetical protein